MMKTNEGRASIRDIAKLAGVSIATVSRVLNRKPDVKAELCERVLEVVKRLEYRPNPIASNLARKYAFPGTDAPGFATKTIAFLSAAPDAAVYAQDEFQMRCLLGAESVARARGLNILFHSCREQAMKGEIPALVAKGQVDGVIIKDARGVPDSWLENLDALLPTVLVSWRLEGAGKPVSSVQGDNASAIRKALRRLKELGHESVGFLNVADLDQAPSFDHLQRRKAYEESVATLSLRATPGLLQEPLRDPATQSLEAVVATALKAWLSMGELRPTAACCATDVYAIAVSKAARSGGLSIPEDLSLIGFMNTNAAALNDPPLSSLGLPSEAMGEAAANLLLERIANPSMAPRNVLVDCPLIERSSCARRSMPGGAA